MNILLTALAPIFWSTTYFVTTELLPEGRPLLAGALRALPVGIWIVLSYRKLPQGIWWWRVFLLGTLNIGLFFVLLFVAAYRLPGGIAATLGAIQPLIVAGLAWMLLAQRPRVITLLASVVGIVGVALLVLAPGAELDVWGVVAALAGTVSMATGVVLAKRWVRPVPVLLFTGWQLLVGGLLVAMLSLLIEGLPPQLTTTNVLGFSYLGIVGTGLAYTLWFRGIERIGVSVSFLGLLSPLVATLIGYVVLGQHLSSWQLTGGILILVSVVVGNWQGQQQKAPQNEPITGTVPQPACN